MEGGTGAELGVASLGCPLTALPESLLRHLVSRLPAPTLARLALCCKQLRSLINDPALWRVLDLSSSVVCDDDLRSKAAALPVLRAVLSTFGAHVEQLHLDGYSQHTVLALFAGQPCTRGKLHHLRLFSPVIPGDLCRPEAAPMQTLDSVSRLLAALAAGGWGDDVVLHLDMAVALDASLPALPERPCIRLRNVFISQHGDPFTRGAEVSSAGVHALTTTLARGIASCPRGVYLRAFTPNHMALSHIKNLRGLQELALFPPPASCEAAPPLVDLSILYSPAAAVMAWPLDSIRDARGPLFHDDSGDDADLGPPADFFDTALCAVHPCALLTLQTLCLRGNGLDGDAFTRGLVRTVRRLLRRGTSVPLTSLDLRDNRLRDAGVVSLSLLWPRAHGDAACTMGRVHLQTLKLAGNGITSVGVEALANGLTSPLCELTTLDLGGSKLCAAACGFIAHALTMGSRLTSLDVYHCSVSNSGAALLAAALSVSGSLRHLRLGRNCITDDGCVALCGAMRGNTWCGLQSLDLSYNAIGAAGGLALADALRSPGCKLRVLNLRINQLGATGCAAVGVACLEAWQLHGTGLAKLVLARNLMTDDAAVALAAALAACAEAPISALELDVGHNDTTAVGHAALLRAAAALGRGAVTLRGVDGTLDLHEPPSPRQQAQLAAPPPPLATEALDATQWGMLLL